MHPQSNWTIPNLITLFRIVLVPVFVVLFIDQRFGAALVVFLVAGVSDGLDGFLARVLQQRSQLGALLDPVADKLLLVTAYLSLGLTGLLPSWLAVLVISRDLLIIGGMALLHIWGVDVRARIQPTRLSKVNTCGQIVLIIGVLAMHSFALPWHGLVLGLVVLVTASTVLSGIHYVAIGLGHFSGDGQRPVG
ncbi:CDP-alcohol phosphatidyltransferase family protein [Desulfonatronum thioautotrophicum]|uniref:CDP-alcohol phosphatidyltransferase family protein n=1 Tax=Desulfonatronum thioautotrophicum TaxID=617001 RepID=UPI0005EB9163|nr:CDP-alcohol phosphatidyltransferase family protein [Desulfonatronum thioautotrophicum]